MEPIRAALRLLVSAVLAQTPSPSTKRSFTFEDMMKLKRVGAPVPSPDGKWVVFDCVDVDLEANTRMSHLWIVPASGGESRRLNPTPNHEERPRFSPDGKRLIWTSKATDPTQIWMCDFDSESGVLGGKTHQVTEISTGGDGGIWSPDGKNIVCVYAVNPDCKEDGCNKQRDEELKKSKVKAKIFSRLFYRHWSAFTEFKRSHLFVQSVEAPVSGAGNGTAAGTAATTPRDRTPADHDVPPFSLGGQDMYAISPEGQEVAYTSNIDEVEATSTNNEIFVVPISVGHASGLSASDTQARGSRYSKKISTSPGADTTPLYSPNGKYLAWRSQARAGFEADKWRLLVQDRQSGKARDLTEKLDRSIGNFVWWGDSRGILFTVEDLGSASISVVWSDGTMFGEKPGQKKQQFLKIHDSENADDLAFAHIGNASFVFFAKSTVKSPAEIWRLNLGYDDLAITGIPEVPEPVTHMNDALLSQIDMQPLESF